jgi:hypothetical protein
VAEGVFELGKHFPVPVFNYPVPNYNNPAQLFDFPVPDWGISS